VPEGDLDPGQRALRTVVVAVAEASSTRLGRAVPFAPPLRWLGNHLVPWAARTAYRDGVHRVNGVRMEIPRPPDWGGGGEFHMALGTYERHELACVLDRLRPGDTFVDAGAHIGYFSLPVARRVGPAGRVVALEPSPPSLELLRRNVALNGFDWVTVVGAAAACEDGRARLQVSEHSAMWNTLRADTLDAESNSIPVTTRCIDSVVADLGWPRVAGIKLDVEGAESEVLRGAEQVLARSPGAFLTIEVSGGGEERIAASMQTLGWLEERGYRFRRMGRGGTGPPCDAAALRALLRRPSWLDSLFNLVAEKA
jgi:FkbM family methyltransferase